MFHVDSYAYIVDFFFHEAVWIGISYPNHVFSENESSSSPSFQAAVNRQSASDLLSYKHPLK
jgi:hypothetical protein